MAGDFDLVNQMKLLLVVHGKETAADSARPDLLHERKELLKFSHALRSYCATLQLPNPVLVQ